MGCEILLSSGAEKDLKGIFEYYRALNEETGKKYYYGIMENIEYLSDHPKMGRVVPEFIDDFYDKYRELIFEKFRILYRIDVNQVIIIRIVDGRQLLGTTIL